jgi:inward rectifier potassium channel
MVNPQNGRASKTRVIRLGDREVITEGLHLNFWADISHRCMTASWPAFIAGAALVFVVFNAIFASLYWIGHQPISNVPDGGYIDYLYFSIETLSTAGYGDMHPQTHYGHFIATVELFTGIFSMSLMTGLIFARFSRPNARLLFVDNPVISIHEGKPTLMIRLANERDNIISNATARLWLFKKRGAWRASRCGGSTNWR